MERKEVRIRVKDVMTGSLVSVDAEKSVMEAARLTDQKKISPILVRHANELLGME